MSLLNYQTFPQLVAPVDFETIRSLTAFMQTQISSGTIYAPNWQTIRVAKLAARMYAPLGTQMTLGDHVRVTRVFADAFSGVYSGKWKEQKDDQNTSGWGSGKSTTEDEAGTSFSDTELQVIQQRRDQLAKDLGVSMLLLSISLCIWTLSVIKLLIGSSGISRLSYSPWN